MKFADVRALARERAERLVAVGARARASVRFWPARIFSTSSVSRSAGFARWITSFSSLAAAGEAGAELVDQDREPLRGRAAA